jgi:capsular polysaccharide biosynthesis protein
MHADDRFDPSHNRETRVSSRSIVRRLALHWRRILLLWLLLATPMAYMIYILVEPTYEAFSLLQVQPVQHNLFEPGLRGSTDSRSAQPYMETQVQLIVSDRVLDAAISQPATMTTPRMVRLPMIASSKDPKALLRKELAVEIVKDTFLIRVALSSRDPEEAAAIVNAVVSAYLEQHSEYHKAANAVLKRSLEGELKALEAQITQKTGELKALYGTGPIAMNRPMAKPDTTVKDDDTGIHPTLATVTEEQYTRATDRLLEADLDLIDARARLETARLAKAPAPAKLPELEAAVEEARRKRIGYVQYIARLEIQTKDMKSDTFSATMKNQELSRLLKMQDIIEQKLEQLRFEQKEEVFRVMKHDEAQVPKVPANNRRLKYMAALPVGIMFLVLGFFLMLEVKSARVGDNDALSPDSPMS